MPAAWTGISANKDPPRRPAAYITGAAGKQGHSCRGRRPGSAPAAEPRHPIPVAAFPEPAAALRHHPQLRLYPAPPHLRLAERFTRTPIEQVIYGRIFQNLEEVRTAVRRFVDTYNRQWLVEKNGYQSLWQARAQWLAQQSARTA